MKAIWRASVVVLLAASFVVASAHDALLSCVRLIVPTSSACAPVVSASTTGTLLRGVIGEGKPSDATYKLVLEQRLRACLRDVKFDFAQATWNVDLPADRISVQVPVREGIEKFRVEQGLTPAVQGSATSVVVLKNGQTLESALVDAAHPDFERNRSEATNQVLALSRYLGLGVEHILSGYDHLAFVIGLLLIGGSIRGTVKTVTSFTLAHSITLAAASLGIWTPPTRLVESLIALSIVGVGIEAYRRRSGADRRIAYAFGFGLIHGFGFAGALSEVGLPSDRLPASLGGFNLGVELGQLAVVGIAAPLLMWLEKSHPSKAAKIIPACSICIGCCGLVWLAQRIGG